MSSNDGHEPGRRLDLALDDTLIAPSAARDAVDTWLRGHGVSAAVQRDVILAVSELVTNAVTHAASAPRLTITLLPECIRLEVVDDSPAPPRVREISDASGGFGLRLVGHVTENWGWRHASAGKVVWAEFRLDDAD